MSVFGNNCNVGVPSAPQVDPPKRKGISNVRPNDHKLNWQGLLRRLNHERQTNRKLCEEIEQLKKEADELSDALAEIHENNAGHDPQ